MLLKLLGTPINLQDHKAISIGNPPTPKRIQAKTPKKGKRMIVEDRCSFDFRVFVILMHLEFEKTLSSVSLTEESCVIHNVFLCTADTIVQLKLVSLRCDVSSHQYYLHNLLNGT